MSSPFLPLYRQFPSDEPRNLERQLVDFHTQTNTAVNNRTISTFTTDPVSNGERWFSPQNTKLRDGSRVVVQIPSILNGATTIAHGIPSFTYVTRLYGTANNGTTFIPLEHSTSTEVISISMNATNVILTTTTANWVGYSGTVVIEFL